MTEEDSEEGGDGGKVLLEESVEKSERVFSLGSLLLNSITDGALIKPVCSLDRTGVVSLSLEVS